MPDCHSSHWHIMMTTAILAFAMLLSGCNDSKNVKSPDPAAAPTEQAQNQPSITAPPDSGPLPRIDANRALQYTKEVTAFGPRPIGSANHKKLESYIYAHLKGDEVQDDYFMVDTPQGKLPVRNIIAKYPGSKDGIIVIAGHYDTPYYLRDTGFVGANDGGSSTGLLLELANQLRGKKRDGYSVWLLFTDGEEAVKEWTDTDSVYGTKHIADIWEKDGTLKKVKAFLLQDMIGYSGLDVDRDENSTPWLLDIVNQAAMRYGYQSHFFNRTAADLDDHIPFAKKGVPVADLIDLNYGYANSFWHTTQDTMDKLSPKSLQMVGDVLLETVMMLDNIPNLPTGNPQFKAK